MGKNRRMPPAAGGPLSEDDPQRLKGPARQSRTIEIVIKARSLRDPRALLWAVQQALGIDQTCKAEEADQAFAEPNVDMITNEQLEAKVGDRVSQHLDSKPSQDPGIPAIDLEKAIESRAELVRMLDELAGNGWSCTVTSNLLLEDCPTEKGL